MARVLIVGCGCRGQQLARALVTDGHAVRGTTRDAAGADAIAAAGAEPYVGDPFRLGTLIGALDGTTILCWLLASASGPAEEVTALNGPRLERILEEIVDTPVRGVVYEAVGTVDPALLATGTAIAENARATWSIPLEIVAHDPSDHAGWTAAARGAVAALLG